MGLPQASPIGVEGGREVFQAVTATDWAESVNGRIQATHDAGKTWSRATPMAGIPTDTLLVRLDLTTPTTGWARATTVLGSGKYCGSPEWTRPPLTVNDALLKTTDGGRTWTSVTLP